MRPSLLIPALLALFHGESLAAERPNILLIYTDDHGWADLGAQGVDQDIRTPNLDRLARDGVRFARGYVSAPQCVPSRAGVITGRYQQKFGVEDNNKGPLPLAELTIAERLKPAGYLSGFVGKNHLNIGGKKGEPKSARILPDHLPHRQGFDEYFSGEMRQFHASHALDGTPFADAPRLVSENRFRVVVQTEAALSFLDRRAGRPQQPWFLYLAWFAPHVPLESPEPWFSKTSAHLPKERRQALAMIAAMDDGLGQIRAKLQAMGQDQNTLIFFIGDNGAPLKSGAWDGSLNAPLIGEKGMLTDGGIRVPFVAAWPGKIPAGQVCEHPVISLDVAATAVESAGAFPPSDAPPLDGVNLIPFLTGENKAAPHDALYWRWRSQAAVLEFPWKLIQLGDHEKFLFDVTEPDGELATNNRLGQHPDIAARLETRLKTWSATLQPPGPPEPDNDQDNGFYSDHVTKTEPPKAKSRGRGAVAAGGPFQGWICRNGTLGATDGALIITPDVAAKGAPFVANATLDLPGPVNVTLRARATTGGKVTASWRTAGQKDFTAGQAVTFDWPAGADWQEVRFDLPAEGRLIHLRLAPAKSASGLRLQSIELRGKDGRAQSFRFDSASVSPPSKPTGPKKAVSPAPTPKRITDAPYQNVFAAPRQAPEADLAYGEPAIAWHAGEYFLIYDNFDVPNGPACLMTSKEGVYWKEEGAIHYPDADHDDGCIECPDLRQFTPGGPFVLSYDAKLKGRDYHVRRFAVSDDLRHWKKVDGLEFAADPRFYKPSPFYNQYSITSPDGGWFAVLNAAPKDFMGLGLGRSTDGMHWECLPPLRVTGVSDQQFGRAGPACKAVETSGIVRHGGWHFIFGGSPLAGADVILASRDIAGPYAPAAKNAIHLRGPQVFQRIYHLPEGPLSMPMIWADRERRSYHVAPFRSVFTEDGSLWFKWWKGNDALKSRPLPAALDETPVGPGGLRMLAQTFSPAAGVVLEAEVILPPNGFEEPNLALGAKATASAALARDWWPEGYFAARRAVDGTTTTAWRIPAIEKIGPAAAKKAAPLTPVSRATLELDLGEARDIGTLRMNWLLLPAALTIYTSRDGREWTPLPIGPLPPARPRGGQSTQFENLRLTARHLRAEVQPGGQGAALSEFAVLPDASALLPEVCGGLLLESKPGEGWAWLLTRDGRIRHGEVRDAGRRFHLLKERELDRNLGSTAVLRLVWRDDLLELYANNFHVDYYQLRDATPSGRIGLYALVNEVQSLRAWQPASPQAKGQSREAHP